MIQPDSESTTTLLLSGQKKYPKNILFNNIHAGSKNLFWSYLTNYSWWSHDSMTYGMVYIKATFFFFWPDCIFAGPWLCSLDTSPHVAIWQVWRLHLANKAVRTTTKMSLLVIGTGRQNPPGCRVRVSRVRVRVGICAPWLNPYPRSGLPGYPHVICHRLWCDYSASSSLPNGRFRTLVTSTLPLPPHIWKEQGGMGVLHPISPPGMY